MSRKLLDLGAGRPLLRRVLLAQVLGPPRYKSGPHQPPRAGGPGGPRTPPRRPPDAEG